MKKTLVFYRGRAPKGEKSNWVMHEYRLEGKFAYHYFSRSSRDEWVISRVFQKSGSGSSTGCSGSACTGVGGGRKARVPSHFLYSEASSASSATLPPLHDSSTPHPALTDGRDSCSYVDSGPTPKEHVSCFSTIPSAFDGSSFGGGAGFFPLGPQFPSQFRRNGNGYGTQCSAGGVSVSFPSLRSLQDNLQLPSQFLPAIPVVGPEELGGGCSASGYNLCDQSSDHKADGWSVAGAVRSIGLGASELDCMWSY
ncbi:hypothetical protein SAY87_005115 [Trapa incisa]|uniref:NAC domain-containing protein n=1 Tax=Trapa incisa TaxID=236973 RepID=A0AAN7JQT6_9MYRT|nr:hypothetical protein SAY87_005115 [Trapa incisa]